MAQSSKLGRQVYKDVICVGSFSDKFSYRNEHCLQGEIETGALELFSLKLYGGKVIVFLMVF